MTIFKRIINKEVPATIVYEDDVCLCFKDINPQAPVHLLLIPKKEIPSLDDIGPDDKDLMGHLVLMASKIASDQGLGEAGYRVVNNVKGYGGQDVPHLHLHILGGRKMTWPPG